MAAAVPGSDRWLTVACAQASGVSVLLRAGMTRAARREGALPLVIGLCPGGWAGSNGQVKAPGPADGGIEAAAGVIGLPERALAGMLPWAVAACQPPSARAGPVRSCARPRTRGSGRGSVFAAARCVTGGLGGVLGAAGVCRLSRGRRGGAAGPVILRNPRAASSQPVAPGRAGRRNGASVLRRRSAEEGSPGTGKRKGQVVAAPCANTKPTQARQPAKINTGITRTKRHSRHDR
jgi:hypothetical protein